MLPEQATVGDTRRGIDVQQYTQATIWSGKLLGTSFQKAIRAFWGMPMLIRASASDSVSSFKTIYVESVAFCRRYPVVAESAEQLQCLVSEFGRVCKRRKLRVNVDKSKVMSVEVNVGPSMLNIVLNGERMEVVNSFKYLGTCFSSDGGVKEGVSG